jgi:hypothetical protein
MNIYRDQNCLECGGTGYMYDVDTGEDTDCPYCAGSGYTEDLLEDVEFEDNSQ